MNVVGVFSAMPLGSPNQFMGFNYAAVYYLWVWYLVDRSTVEEFQQEISLEKLQNFLLHYQVARTIPGDGIPRLKYFRDAIHETRSIRLTRENTADIVDRVHDGISKRYGRNCLSAVSKAMWMLHRHPVAILDRLARKSLCRELNCYVPAKYSEYYQLWNDAYRKRQREVEDAQNWLPNSQFATRVVFHHLDSQNEVSSITKADWFANRIFDIWLVKTSTNVNLADVALIIGPHEAS